MDDEAPEARPQVIPVFMGVPWAQKFGGTGSELSFREWKSQTEYLASLQGLSEAQKLQFVLGSLEGEAKREVFAAPEDKRNGVKKVFDLLEVLYGDATPAAVLRAQFFNCRQGPRQSLRSFSLQIRELFYRLKRRSDHGLGEGDSILRDQFLLGLQDGPIRQSLRLQLRRTPTLTFEELREETLALELDHSGAHDQPMCMATTSATAPAPPPAVDWKQELRAEIMKDVKEQMAALSQTLLQELRGGWNAGQSVPRERSYSDSGREPRGRPGQSSSYRFEWDDQGRPICNRCREPGHISRHCSRGARRGSHEGF